MGFLSKVELKKQLQALGVNIIEGNYVRKKDIEIISKSIVIGGHSTVMYFSKSARYEDALKDLKIHKENDNIDNDYNGDWQNVSKPKTEYPVETGGYPNVDAVKRYFEAWPKYKKSLLKHTVFAFSMTDGTYLFLTGDGYAGTPPLPPNGIVIKAKSLDVAKIAFNKKFPEVRVTESESHAQESHAAFPTLEAAKEWARRNVNDYDCYALQVTSPKGWLFAADVHH